MTAAELSRIDALTATEIMGWAPEDENQDYGWSSREWQPTRRIEQAWEVLEKFELFKIYSLRKRSQGFNLPTGYAVNIDGHEKYADTAPIAICLAALKAKGVSHVEG